MLSFAGLVGFISLFPSYIKVASEHAESERIVNKSSGIDSSLEQFRFELENDAILLESLTSNQSLKYSDIILSTISARGSVAITAVSFEDTASSTVSLVIQGVAPTRDDLVEFKTRLENMSVGNTVVLPVSELAQSKDIKFSLRFITIFQ